MVYVYELYDLLGNVVYVGESNNPHRRFNRHTKAKPQPNNGSGKFYGQTLVMHIVASFEDRKAARLLEGQLKLEYGMEWSEKLRDSRAGKIGGSRKKPKRSNP